MSKQPFASTGVIVGQTPRSKYEQRNSNLKSNSVTMGNGTPTQSEGSVGDITVREISLLGLRCYIKTKSGWYDINTMESKSEVKWLPMILENSWVRYSTAYSVPSYFKDENGFVHLRGGLKDGTGVTADVTTLPEGFRPGFTTIVAAATATARHSVKILTGGEVNFANGGSTSLSFLDGISFYAGQKIISRGGGSGGSGSAEGGSHGGGGA